MITTSYKVVSIEELINTITHLESEKSKLEEKNNELQTHLNTSNLNIEKYIEETRLLREEKRLLEVELENTKKRLEKLENENKQLIKDVIFLKDENTKMKEQYNVVIYAQCVLNYKLQLLEYILYEHDDLRGIDLFCDVLNNNIDDEMTENEIKRKNAIISFINSKYKTVSRFQNLLKDITDIRNGLSHPNITNYNELKPEFLKFCNSTWKNDKNGLNQKLTNDIFNALIDNKFL